MKLKEIKREKIVQIISHSGWVERIYGLTEYGDIYQLDEIDGEWKFITFSPESDE